MYVCIYVCISFHSNPALIHVHHPPQVYYAPRLAFYQSATLPTLFGIFPFLRRTLVAERINLVHAHQAFSPMAHEAIMHSRTMGHRVVFTDHSLFGFADAASILMNKALKFTLADVHAVICVSHTSKENTVLRACIPPDRVSVIPNGECVRAGERWARKMGCMMHVHGGGRCMRPCHQHK